MIVKYTWEKRYCAAVHKFCADRGIAPRLPSVDESCFDIISLYAENTDRADFKILGVSK